MAKPIHTVLDFERPIAEVDAKISELKGLAAEHGLDLAADVNDLERQREEIVRSVFSQLSPWDKTQMARHPQRPHTLDYIRCVCEEFVELHGDRRFGDDAALVGGLAMLDGQPILIVGHQKGRDAKERARRNFGYARPEGYRKALRLMQLAEKCGRPIVSFVDIPAADPSVGSEERGISEAIAWNMREMSLLKVPIIVVVVGEGGSGGAIGIGVGDRVLMLEHSIYSVIPPEGCAALIWRDKDRAGEAAMALRPTAQDALRFGVIDEILSEPMGGAHRDLEATAAVVKSAILRHLAEVSSLDVEGRLEQRYARFRKLGAFEDLQWRESQVVAAG